MARLEPGRIVWTTLKVHGPVVKYVQDPEQSLSFYQYISWF